MFTIASLTEFLGWSAIINVCALTFASVSIMLMRNWMVKFHGRMFGLDTADISRAYFQYIAQYKLLVIFFNLVPYVSLKIME